MSLHRDRVEAELSEAQLLGLGELCADLGIPLANWQHVPRLYGFAVLAAGLRLVRRGERDRGWSRRVAVQQAARALGVRERQLESMLRRAVEDGIRAA